ncbi:MAG: PepSY domain-containing protein [Spirochaetes bacterium]|nr:PepSY domain-containing protein [Spirochaetota bacterium]
MKQKSVKRLLLALLVIVPVTITGCDMFDYWFGYSDSSPSPSPTGSPAATTSGSGLLGVSAPAVSQDAAIQIASEHLAGIGLEPGQARGARIEQQNGQWVWSVSFGDNGTEHALSIDVSTGEVVE